MGEKIAHLGKRTGKMLLFGGVYSNLQALEELIQIAKAEKIPPSNCICTGDILGYCAQPEETVQQLKAWGAKSIAGNVELQVVGDKDDCGCDFESGGRCDTFSRTWFPYTKANLSKDSKEWIASLPEYLAFEYGGKKVMVVHGSFGNVSEYIFKSTERKVKESQLNDVKSDVIIAGHCGLPFHEKLQNGIWLNPGVIGMPANDGTPRVWYMTLEGEETFRYTHHPYEYDSERTKRHMLDNVLPKSYADTLTSGIWDNMEILPPIEKSEQGKALFF